MYEHHSPPTTATPELLRAMRRRMLTIRQFEERALELSAAGEIHGVVHPYIGQEATAVGICSALHVHDHLTSTHRGHGHCIAKGAQLEPMFAELLGRVGGYCGGKGGSMHIADFQMGILGANGIVGAGIPIAAGAALRSQLTGDSAIAVAFFGDGAVGTGTFHETMNLASLWQLPLVCVCENNQWQANTALESVLAAEHLGDLVEAHGIPAARVDGNDVVAVHEAATTAVTHVRSGAGPWFIEANTYRWKLHAYAGPGGPDPRPSAELGEWLARDPIDILDQRMIATGIVTDAELDVEYAGVIKAVDNALETARSSPRPSVRTAREAVFADGEVNW